MHCKCRIKRLSHPFHCCIKSKACAKLGCALRWCEHLPSPQVAHDQRKLQGFGRGGGGLRWVFFPQHWRGYQRWKGRTSDINGRVGMSHRPWTAYWGGREGWHFAKTLKFLKWLFPYFNTNHGDFNAISPHCRKWWVPQSFPSFMRYLKPLSPKEASEHSPRVQYW